MSSWRWTPQNWSLQSSPGFRSDWLAGTQLEHFPHYFISLSHPNTFQALFSKYAVSNLSVWAQHSGFRSSPHGVPLDLMNVAFLKFSIFCCQDTDLLVSDLHLKSRVHLALLHAHESPNHRNVLHPPALQHIESYWFSQSLTITLHQAVPISLRLLSHLSLSASLLPTKR